MKVRLATAQDRDIILSLSLGLAKESRFSIYKPNIAKIQSAVDTLMRDSVMSCILLAEHSSQGVVGLLAGYMTEYFFTDVRLAQDKWFYVLPAYRGSAAALKLLIAFRKWAENRQAQELCINMSVDIDQARFNRFMHHLQFKSCGSNFVLPLTKHS